MLPKCIHLIDYELGIHPLDAINAKKKKIALW